MELALCIAIAGAAIGALAWAVTQYAPRRLVDDPGRLRTELARWLERGDDERVRAVLSALPDWPIRDGLVAAAGELAALSRSLDTGQFDALPREVVRRIRDGGCGARTVLADIAAKLAALSPHVDRDWSGVPASLRDWVETDHETVRRVGEAAGALHARLADEVTHGRRGEDSHARLLPVLEPTLRDLAAPDGWAHRLDRPGGD